MIFPSSYENTDGGLCDTIRKVCGQQPARHTQATQTLYRDDWTRREYENAVKLLQPIGDDESWIAQFLENTKGTLEIT